MFSDNLNIRKNAVALAALLLVFSVLCGYIVSTGNIKLTIIFVAIIVALPFAWSARLLLWTTLFGGLVVSGLAQLYAPHLELIRWCFVITSIVLILHTFNQIFKTYTAKQPFVIPSLLFWNLIFLLVMLISALINQITPGEFLIGFKGYFQVWGLLFALGLIDWQRKVIDWLPKFFLLIAIIQIPFVMHQYLVLMPFRSSIQHIAGLVPIDVVAGTFGANKFKGGANAALSLYLFIIFSTLCGLWINGQMNKKLFLPLSLIILAPVFLNSTKISIFYLIVLIIIIFGSKAFSKPAYFISILIAAGGLIAGMIFSAIIHLPNAANIHSMQDLWQYTYSYNFERQHIMDDNLSRFGALQIWLAPHYPHELINILFGYGPTASRDVGSTGGQLISRLISLDRPTGSTAISAILWETGLFGISCVVAIFISAYQTVVQLKRMLINEPFMHGICQGLQCAVVLLFISLLHKNFFVFHIGYQTILYSVFGYIIYWQGQLKNNHRISA